MHRFNRRCKICSGNIEKEISNRSKGVSYNLTVIINDEEYTLNVFPLVYEEYDVNDYITLYEYDGLFAGKYYEYQWEYVYIYEVRK